jgi:hypothetical protein
MLNATEKFLGESIKKTTTHCSLNHKNYSNKNNSSLMMDL